MDKRKIQVVHLPDSDSIHRGELMDIIQTFYDRLSTFLPGELFLEVVFKESHRHLGKAEYEIRCNVKFLGKNLHSQALGWDSIKTLRQSLEALLKEAKKIKEKSE